VAHSESFTTHIRTLLRRIGQVVLIVTTALRGYVGRLKSPTIAQCVIVEYGNGSGLAGRRGEDCICDEIGRSGYPDVSSACQRSNRGRDKSRRRHDLLDDEQCGWCGHRCTRPVCLLQPRLEQSKDVCSTSLTATQVHTCGGCCALLRDGLLVPRQCKSTCTFSKNFRSATN
jgi:hypothetical protein